MLFQLVFHQHLPANSSSPFREHSKPPSTSATKDTPREAEPDKLVLVEDHVWPKPPGLFVQITLHRTMLFFFVGKKTYWKNRVVRKVLMRSTVTGIDDIKQSVNKQKETTQSMLTQMLHVGNIYLHFPLKCFI